MQELGVPGSQLLLAAEQPYIHGIFIALYRYGIGASYSRYLSSDQS